MALPVSGRSQAKSLIEYPGKVAWTGKAKIGTDFGNGFRLIIIQLFFPIPANP